MNKIYSILLSAAIACAFTACVSEEGDLFNASAAERLNQTSAVYSARLEAQPNGWAMQYYPTYQDQWPQGGGYLLLMDFDKDQMVRVAMLNEFTDNAFKVDSSAWEIIADNGPVLTFNTYNECMHMFSDPEDIVKTDDSDPVNNKSNTLDETGEGFGGDYEFIIVDAPEDASYMMLKGKKRGTYNLLTPVEQGVDYKDYLTDLQTFQKNIFPVTAPVGSLLCFGEDSIYSFEEAGKGLPSIYPRHTDKVTRQIFNPFLITKRGSDYFLRFRDEFKRTDMSGVLQDMRYDSLEQAFVGVENSKFRIEGYRPGWFLREYVQSAPSNRWVCLLKDSMSVKMRAIVDEVNAEFENLQRDNKGNPVWSYVGFDLRYNMNSDSLYRWNINYKSRQTASVGYQFTGDIMSSRVFSPDDLIEGGTHIAEYRDIVTKENAMAYGATFTYQSPYGESEANMLTRLPSMNKLLQALSREFIVSTVKSKFDLTYLRLTAKDDADLWFDLKK